MRNLMWIGGLLAIFAAIRILASVLIPVPIDVKDTTDLVLTASFFGISMLLLAGYVIAAIRVAWRTH